MRAVREGHVLLDKKHLREALEKTHKLTADWGGRKNTLKPSDVEPIRAFDGTLPGQRALQQLPARRKLEAQAARDRARQKGPNSAQAEPPSRTKGAGSGKSPGAVAATPRRKPAAGPPQCTVIV